MRGLVLTDEQQEALRAALTTFQGCGIEKLENSELADFGERLILCLLDAERFGYEQGWAAALTAARDYQAAAIESRQLKRAHS